VIIIPLPWLEGPLQSNDYPQECGGTPMSIRRIIGPIPLEAACFKRAAYSLIKRLSVGLAARRERIENQSGASAGQSAIPFDLRLRGPAWMRACVGLRNCALNPARDVTGRSPFPFCGTVYDFSKA
jgi:hypothetical protein